LESRASRFSLRYRNLAHIGVLEDGLLPKRRGWECGKPTTRRRSHLIRIDDLAAFLLARLLGYQDEAFALAGVHPLATVVEALADALTLAAIGTKAGDQCFLLLLALVRAGIFGAGRIRKKGDRNRARNYRSSGVRFHLAQVYLQIRVMGNSGFPDCPQVEPMPMSRSMFENAVWKTS
jgi:hypothetical protein